MADGHNLPARFGDWLRLAQKETQLIENNGGRVFRAVIKPEAFAAWCAIRNLNVDAKARNAFANEYAARQVRGG